LQYFSCNYNLLSGYIPELSNNINLIAFACTGNNLDGYIPDLSNNTLLETFICIGNQLTNYYPSTISIHCISFDASNNLLIQTAVDQILQDFATDISSRPLGGVLNLGGTGNASPSSAGLINKALIEAHLWTVTTN